MEYIKYPRTFHLWNSEALANDDKFIESLDGLVGQDVVVTEKMDGENTTMTCERCYARSLDSVSHFTRDWVRSFWATIQHELPLGWRFCGENLYARHAIAYDNLPSFFIGFSIWDESNTALPWDDAVSYMTMLGITPAPVIYRGVFDLDAIHSAFLQYRSNLGREVEGYVVRRSGPIPHEQFGMWAAKWVRRGHVQGDSHWMYGGKQIETNKLAA